MPEKRSRTRNQNPVAVWLIGIAPGLLGSHISTQVTC
jgi:hypothetical protein